MDLPDALDTTQETLEPLFGLMEADMPCPSALMQVANCTKGVGKLIKIIKKKNSNNICLEKMKWKWNEMNVFLFFLSQRSVKVSLSRDLSKMLPLQKQVERFSFSFEDVVE